MELEFIPVGRAKDLTNKTFGKLKVLGRAPHEFRGAYWWCECSCENHTIKKVLGSHLISGEVQSCGCYQKEKIGKYAQTRKNDLTGKVFGKLTVIEDSGLRRENNKGIIWKCQCECGNISYVRGDSLQSGDIYSCGCAKRSRGEIEIENILINSNIIYEKEKSFPDFHYNNNLKSHPRFDFYLPSHNLIIEFDGAQHFFENSGYMNSLSLQERQKRDIDKDKYCKEKGIKLKRIPYTMIGKITLNDLLKGDDCSGG